MINTVIKATYTRHDNKAAEAALTVATTKQTKVSKITYNVLLNE